MTTDAIDTVIVAALPVGATSGATDAANNAVVDAYDGLKYLLKRFGTESNAVEAIDKLEVKPNAEGR